MRLRRVGGVWKGGNDSRVSTVRTERAEVIIVDRRGELRTGRRRWGEIIGRIESEIDWLTES